MTIQAARTVPKRKSRNVALTALRVSGRVIFERVARPMAHTLEDVPCSPHAITPEWLTAAICGKTPDAIVTSVLVERSSAGTHERHRLHVTYNQAGSQAGLPPSIFTKRAYRGPVLFRGAPTSRDRSARLLLLHPRRRDVCSDSPA